MATVDLARRKISIHALREEGDRRGKGQHRCRADFYPRPPRGGRQESSHTRILLENFYPRPPRGGRPASRFWPYHDSHISIHALREEGDDSRDSTNKTAILFLSTPSARRATIMAVIYATLIVFLSTPSARRATCAAFPCPTPTTFLSTPSARRATQFPESRCPPIRISIHALREEGDPAFPRYSYPHPNFYPRPPRGGRRSPNTNNNNNV